MRRRAPRCSPEPAGSSMASDPQRRCAPRSGLSHRRLGIVVLEQPGLVGLHVRRVVPALARIMRQVIDLSTALWIHEIDGAESMWADTAGITDREWPVAQRAGDRAPHVDLHVATPQKRGRCRAEFVRDTARSRHLREIRVRMHHWPALRIAARPQRQRLPAAHVVIEHQYFVCPGGRPYGRRGLGVVDLDELGLVVEIRYAAVMSDQGCAVPVQGQLQPGRPHIADFDGTHLEGRCRRRLMRRRLVAVAERPTRSRPQEFDLGTDYVRPCFAVYYCVHDAPRCSSPRTNRGAHLNSTKRARPQRPVLLNDSSGFLLPPPSHAGGALIPRCALSFDTLHESNFTAIRDQQTADLREPTGPVKGQ